MDDIARDFSTKKRKQLAKEGKALSDGSFPIVTKADLKNAVQAYGRASNKSKVKRHIIKRARALGATNLLPDDWQTDKSEAIMIECDHEGCDRSFLDEQQRADHAQIVHTIEDVRKSAYAAIRERHGKRTWIMDMGPDWLVYEAPADSSDEGYKFVMVSYTLSDGAVSLGDDEREVERKTAYIPATKTESASLAMKQIGVQVSALVDTPDRDS